MNANPILLQKNWSGKYTGTNMEGIGGLKMKIWMKMDHSDFSMDHTLITKGLLVVMLLAYHVLAPEKIAAYGVKTILSDPRDVDHVVSFLRICIAGFAFLSAYGMAVSFKKQKEGGSNLLFVLSFRRLIRLLSGVAAVYILAGLYRQFVMRQSMWRLYENSGICGTAMRMAADMLGMAEYTGTPKINITWWYLSFAVMLILAMPLIYMAYQRFGYFIIPVGCLLPYAVLKDSLGFSMLFPAVLLGTAFACEGWFQSLGSGGKAVKTVICLLIFYGAYKVRLHFGIFCSDMLSFSIPCVVYLLIGRIPILRDCLKLIGRHSGNIFLTHTFIYYYFYGDFVYSFRYSWLIVTVLLGLSLGLSVVIELMKKLTGYNRLADKLLCAYDRKCAKLPGHCG